MSTTPLDSPIIAPSPLKHPNTSAQHSPNLHPDHHLIDSSHLSHHIQQHLDNDNNSQQQQQQPHLPMLDPQHPATAAAMAHILMQAQMAQPAPPMDASTFAAISAQLQAMTTNAIHQHYTPPTTTTSTSQEQNSPFSSSSSQSKAETGTAEWVKQRRDSHKEVERRRREVINTGINELAKIVPNCSDRNKGGILHRAVQYIQQLKEAEQRNAERWTLDKMLADQAINDLTGYVEYLKSENELLRTQISELGGHVPPRAQPPAPSVPSYHAMAAAMHSNAYPSYHHFYNPTQPNQQQSISTANVEPWTSGGDFTPSMDVAAGLQHAHLAATAAKADEAGLVETTAGSLRKRALDQEDEDPEYADNSNNDNNNHDDDQGGDLVPLKKKKRESKRVPKQRTARIDHPSQYTADAGVHQGDSADADVIALPDLDDNKVPEEEVSGSVLKE